MEKIEKYQNILEKSLNEISFARRYKDISTKFNISEYDKLDKKTDKKKILSIFKEMGYTFKYYPGGDFDFREIRNLFSFQILFIIKHGMITNYLNVYLGDLKINKQFNFGFIYRELVGDMNAEITIPKFSNYVEFEKIANEIITLYEDLKNEFLKEAEELF